jgi:hypothetical protein
LPQPLTLASCSLALASLHQLPSRAAQAQFSLLVRQDLTEQPAVAERSNDGVRNAFSRCCDAVVRVLAGEEDGALDPDCDLGTADCRRLNGALGRIYPEDEP